MHHDRLEFLREKGRHPTCSQRNILGLRSRDHGDIAPTSLIWEVLYSLLSTLTHLRPKIRKRAEHCQTNRLERNFQQLLLEWPPGCRNTMLPGWEGAGAEEGGERSFSRGFRAGLLAAWVLSLRKRSRRKVGREDGASSTPNPPPYPTLTSSVSRRGISMEPRDMMRSKGERASCPAAPQPVLLASGSSRG